MADQKPQKKIEFDYEEVECREFTFGFSSGRETVITLFPEDSYVDEEDGVLNLWSQQTQTSLVIYIPHLAYRTSRTFKGQRAKVRSQYSPSPEAQNRSAEPSKSQSPATSPQGASADTPEGA